MKRSLLAGIFLASHR